jgi:CRISPR/Cas system-associated endoribonuclease Cas2
MKNACAKQEIAVSCKLKSFFGSNSLNHVYFSRIVDVQNVATLKDYGFQPIQYSAFIGVLRRDKLHTACGSEESKIWFKMCSCFLSVTPVSKEEKRLVGLRNTG